MCDVLCFFFIPVDTKQTIVMPEQWFLALVSVIPYPLGMTRRIQATLLRQPGSRRSRTLKFVAGDIPTTAPSTFNLSNASREFAYAGMESEHLHGESRAYACDQHARACRKPVINIDPAYMFVRLDDAQAKPVLATKCKMETCK